MAIGNIYVTNDDHFAKGGVRSMIVAPNGDAYGADNAVGSSATGLVATGDITSAAQADEQVYLDFEKESAKMTVSSTKTDALTLYTITIEGYLPAVSGEYLARMHEYAKQDGLRAKVYLWEFHGQGTEVGRPLLVGWDNILAESATYTDFPLILESIEFDTGSALQDQNGATVKFSCVQALPPGQWD